jgi:large subunit ribosomal protein L10
VQALFVGGDETPIEMNKEDKAAAVAELTDRLKEAESIFAIDYRGISVTQAAELRRRLADADATFKIVKNRLAKRAAADAGTETLDELLVGPTALTLIKGDAVIAAKAISSFARESEVLEFKGGVMDGEALDADGFRAIARLPGVEVLRGQLVGVAASPITGLVRGLGSMMSGLAVALGQIAEQGLVGGDAPQPDATPASEEPPSAEAAAEAESVLPAAAEQPETPEELPGEPESEAAAEAEQAAAEAGSADEETSDEHQTDGDEQAPSDESESED